MNASGIPESLRSACAEALDRWPEARAAVLFGSRARGEARRHSDWDIAFITNTDQDATQYGLPNEVEDALSATGLHVQLLALSHQALADCALCLGRVARPIARDGILLAGDWSRPSIEGEIIVEAEKYAVLIENCATELQFASLGLNRIKGDRIGISKHINACNGFIKRSADASEYAAKAVLHRLGVDYDFTHDLAKLGDAAKASGHEGVGEAIKAMNGISKADHTRQCDGHDLSAWVCRNATARLRNLASFLVEEVASGAMWKMLEQAGRTPILDDLEEALEAVSSACASVDAIQPDRDDPPSRIAAYHALREGWADLPEVFDEASSRLVDWRAERDGAPATRIPP